MTPIHFRPVKIILDSRPILTLSQALKFQVYVGKILKDSSEILSQNRFPQARGLIHSFQFEPDLQARWLVLREPFGIVPTFEIVPMMLNNI